MFFGSGKLTFHYRSLNQLFLYIFSEKQLKTPKLIVVLMHVLLQFAVFCCFSLFTRLLINVFLSEICLAYLYSHLFIYLFIYLFIPVVYC